MNRPSHSSNLLVENKKISCGIPYKHTFGPKNKTLDYVPFHLFHHHNPNHLHSIHLIYYLNTYTVQKN